MKLPHFNHNTTLFLYTSCIITHQTYTNKEYIQNTSEVDTYTKTLFYAPLLLRLFALTLLAKIHNFAIYAPDFLLNALSLAASYYTNSTYSIIS
jgi:hypothetical protein